MTVAQAVAAAQAFLLQDYTEQHLNIGMDAKVDAQALLCHLLDANLTYLHTWPDKMLNLELLQQYEKLIWRRKAGEPVAYLTGERGFWTLNLKTDPCTLIPRADTECLVEKALELIPSEQATIVDLGTGTGAIALALASEKPNWQVYACDYNHQAVALAQHNAQLNKALLQLEQLTIVHSDWFSYFEQQQLAGFDLIVTNPPYIAADDEHLTFGDVKFEPRSALVAKEQGYADLYHIIVEAKRFLAPRGWLMLEHGFEQGEKVRDCLRHNGYDAVETIADYSHNERLTIGRVGEG